MAHLALQLGYECSGEEVHDRLSHMRDPDRYAVFVAEVRGIRVAGWIAAHVFRSSSVVLCSAIVPLTARRSRQDSHPDRGNKTNAFPMAGS